jgi:hypothetical protein
MENKVSDTFQCFYRSPDKERKREMREKILNGRTEEEYAQYLREKYDNYPWHLHQNNL